jgi:hypothetical protein
MSILLGRLARLFALALLTVPAWIAQTPAVYAAGQLTLVGQTFNVPATGTVDITIVVPSTVSLDDPSKLEVRVRAYRATTTRVQVASTIAGTLTGLIDEVGVHGDQVITKGTHQIEVRVPLEVDTHRSDALRLPAAGVYPITVEVLTGTTVEADLRSFIHRLPTADEQPEDELQVAMAVSAPMDVALDDHLVVTLDDRTLTGLARLADVLEASSIPMSVQMPPSVIAALASGGPRAAEIGARLTAALQHHNLLSATQLPLDVSQAAAADQTDTYTQWLREGEDSLAKSTSSPTQRTISLISSPLSSAGGAMLRDLGARMLVLPPSIYDVLPHTLGGFTDSTQLVQITVAPDVTIDAAVVDRFAQRTLSQPTTTPQLTSIYAVADLLAARQQIADDGGDPRRHSITLATPDLALPSPDLLRPFTALVANTPGLRPTTLDDLSVRTDQLLNDGKAVVVGLPATVDGDLSNRMSVTNQLALENASTSSMLPATDPRIAEWKHLVTYLPTNSIDDTQAARITDQVHADLSSVRSSVQPPAGFSFNLTGGKGAVPVSIRSDSTIPITVRVRMSSSKLIFPKGDQTVVLAPDTFTEVRVPMEARSNGRFPVTLDVFTPLGDVRLGTPIPLTANVRGLSGLGNLVTGAALLVLLSWWFRHLQRNRRKRHSTKASDRHPSSGADSRDTAARDIDTVVETDVETSADTDADHSGLSPDAATSTLPPS